MIMVIAAWGTCTQGVPECLADVAPLPAGNGQVDVDDLMP
jgi:hypothetical protein